MRIIFVLVLSYFITGCASPIERELGEFWRTKSHENASLGGYGVKVTSMTGTSFVQNGSISQEKLKPRIDKLRSIKLKSIQEAKLDISKNDLAKLGLTYEQVVEQGYKVLITTVSNADEIAKMLPSEKINILDLPDFRFIYGIAQIYDHTQINNILVAGDGAIDLLSQVDGKLVLKGKSNKNIELKYSDGAIVAYTYARICWNSNGTINLLLEELRNPLSNPWIDLFDCPKGTFKNKPAI